MVSAPFLFFFFFFCEVGDVERDGGEISEERFSDAPLALRGPLPWRPS
jgi:hypothetical protein